MTLTLPFINLVLTAPVDVALVISGLFIYFGLSTFLKYLLQAAAICLVLLGLIGVVFVVIK